MAGTAEQREQAIRELRSKNQKDVYELPPELRVIGKSVKIFNVGPFRFQRSMGSYGQWTIHACGDDQTFSTPTEVPYVTSDPIHVDMFQMAFRHDSGRAVALDILGIGQFHTPGEDLTRWGVFISEDEEPTEKELSRARKKLNRTYDELINEADNFWNAGPQHYENIGQMHRLAAKKRSQMNKPWARGVVEMASCDVCGSQLNQGAAICPTCKAVIDEAKVIARKVPGYEYLWASVKE